ncbi:hypothetical protein BDQ12DRAFT_675392 [Crucibulum laeve]|uniref:Uncharacterized protein n=1 Tax=Crucibulum laeve TaxID=68775 RepID=A0A5C3MFI8_9AGAR|nr:hypothetical protein BDQ12DRAFT_675392 [Crucibulum laeve]
MLATIPRRSPLQELPLEHFLPSNPNQPTPFKPNKSNKRALSPGGLILYSPAKRRILCEEGIFSPEKTCKSPLSASRGRSATPARFTDVLMGSDSPAKKLDFGSPKYHAESSSVPRMTAMKLDSTPTRSSSSSSSLAPSPELKVMLSSSSASSFSSDAESEDYFTSADASSSRLSSAPAPTLIPRQLPPPADPQSAHYPGFRVYQDPHIVVFPPLSQEEVAQQTNERHNENLPPRRKARKAASAPTVTDLKAQIFSPESRRREAEKLGLTLPTPNKLSTATNASGSSTTPRRSGFGVFAQTTPSLFKLMDYERKELRRLLEEEVDDAEGEDEHMFT